VTKLAAHRQRKRARKELWGNLGTEEGVDALLETTWKLRGDNLRIYNKAGWGYKDDDSMLMGGYHQTCLGADSTSHTDSGEDTLPTLSPTGGFPPANAN
jgi:hypothetical protein